MLLVLLKCLKISFTAGDNIIFICLYLCLCLFDVNSTAGDNLGGHCDRPHACNCLPSSGFESLRHNFGIICQTKPTGAHIGIISKSFFHSGIGSASAPRLTCLRKAGREGRAQGRRPGRTEGRREARSCPPPLPPTPGPEVWSPSW